MRSTHSTGTLTKLVSGSYRNNQWIRPDQIKQYKELLGGKAADTSGRLPEVIPLIPLPEKSTLFNDLVYIDTSDITVLNYEATGTPLFE